MRRLKKPSNRPDVYAVNVEFVGCPMVRLLYNRHGRNVRVTVPYKGWSEHAETTFLIPYEAPGGAVALARRMFARWQTELGTKPETPIETNGE